jgi:uncharacterized protein YcbX
MQADPSQSPSPEVGGCSVVGLWRYPVKSMMGEELNAAEVTERGLVGDRAFAVIDPATGKVAGAKHPRKWGNFFDFRAAYVEPEEGIRAARRPPHASRWEGRDERPARSGAGPFHGAWPRGRGRGGTAR